jgi:hypothetical protein
LQHAATQIFGVLIALRPRSGAGGRHCQSEITKIVYTRAQLQYLRCFMGDCFAVPEEELFTTRFWWLGFRRALEIADPSFFLHSTHRVLFTIFNFKQSLRMTLDRGRPNISHPKEIAWEPGMGGTNFETSQRLSVGRGRLNPRKVIKDSSLALQSAESRATCRRWTAVSQTLGRFHALGYRQPGVSK